MTDVFVEAETNSATTGTLVCADRRYRCSLGWGGLSTDKREGDGATPIGVFPFRQLLYRADRMAHPPATGLPAHVLTPRTGWCEDPAHPDYNRLVEIPPFPPAPPGVDRMTRDDALYDLVAVIGYNDDPPVPGRGSAIFMHVARAGYAPTAGCVGLAESDLRAVLAVLVRRSRIFIGLPRTAAGG